MVVMKKAFTKISAFHFKSVNKLKPTPTCTFLQNALHHVNHNRIRISRSDKQIQPAEV